MMFSHQTKLPIRWGVYPISFHRLLERIKFYYFLSNEYCKKSLAQHPSARQIGSYQNSPCCCTIRKEKPPLYKGGLTLWAWTGIQKESRALENPSRTSILQRGSGISLNKDIWAIRRLRITFF